MNSIKQIYTNSFNRLTSIFTTKKLELIESLKQSDPQYQTTDFKISIEEDMAPGQNNHDKALRELRKKDREERSKLTLFSQPLQMLKHFFLECNFMLAFYAKKFITLKSVSGLLGVLGFLYMFFQLLSDPQRLVVTTIRMRVEFALYWIGLGFLSSAGFGCGLHTFLLYLGPHIAKVTMGAYECNSVDFVEPNYSLNDEIICPANAVKGAVTIGILQIARKVWWEGCLWGAGTAIGELPPYFLARQAMMSGVDPDDEDYEEAILDAQEGEGDDESLMGKGKSLMKNLVMKLGFTGIMIAASIPNPLFDLAGITCGHFLVPFWTFFGATLIGKAVNKMLIQVVSVILIFNVQYMNVFINWIGLVPVIGQALKQPFSNFLENQRSKYHREPGTLVVEESSSMLKWGYDLLVTVMIGYFIISIMNTMAQNSMARQQKAIREKKMDTRSK